MCPTNSLTCMYLPNASHNQLSVIDLKIMLIIIHFQFGIVNYYINHMVMNSIFSNHKRIYNL